MMGNRDTPRTTHPAPTTRSLHDHENSNWGKNSKYSELSYLSPSIFEDFNWFSCTLYVCTVHIFQLKSLIVSPQVSISMYMSCLYIVFRAPLRNVPRCQTI